MELQTLTQEKAMTEIRDTIREDEPADADKVQGWDHKEAYGRKLWAEFTDGSTAWLSMDTPLADELYQREFNKAWPN